MSDVIFAPNKPTMNISERTEHPTQKPLELIRKLVTAFSFPNDTVFDPFAGSGTTLVTCKELNRNCLGIEINKEYADIIRMRMRKEAKQNQLTQFLG
jgi:DNA modification methylase